MNIQVSKLSIYRGGGGGGGGDIKYITPKMIIFSVFFSLSNICFFFVCKTKVSERRFFHASNACFY